MDTGAATQDPAAVGIALIKSAMPQTYKSIQAKAGEIGSQAYTLVRKGLRGEPNCFWACERGHVVGTPFSDPALKRDIAHLMVQFGFGFVCMWADGAALPAARAES